MQLLLKEGILYRSPTQPVLSRDGTSARWMLNSLAVTLAPCGGEMVGRLILELLKHFDGRQIATYGLTGVPILQSCIIQSGGRYKGLLVRKERKSYGSMKLIEGQIDPNEPTILIDDSISSGTSMEEGIERLEEAGIRVEGAVCLVRFGWHGGYALLQERGYHVEAVYDIFEDFMANMEDEPAPDRNPTRWFPEFQWSPHRAPEALHPAHLARLALTEYFDSGQLLRPPERLDAEYDSSGGAWVSLRSRDDVYYRYARDGFWIFPGEERWTTAENVVRAAMRTALQLEESEEGEPKQLIEKSHIAVTFFSALEKCTVGQLDNDRYGIAVCSLERPSEMGGALPRMPGISNEWEQFNHAWNRNAQLLSFEPFVIYRHDVFKVVEPGVTWQPTGVPAQSELRWYMNPELCGQVAARARDIVISRLLGTDETTAGLSDDLLPDDLDSLYVSVYIQGCLRGCMGSTIESLDSDIRTLSLAAISDDRFGDISACEDADEVAVTISLLFDPLEIGDWSPEEVALRIRHGQQALMVYQNDRRGLLLPFVAATNNLDRDEFVEELIDKAGITRAPYNWCRFECTTWLADSEGLRRLEGGLPVTETSSSPEELLRRFAQLHTRYLMRHQREDGTLFLRYEPFQNRLYEGTSPPRMAHAAWVLARAFKMFGGERLKEASNKILSYHLNAVRKGDECVWIESSEGVPSVAEISFLLLALCEFAEGNDRRALASEIAANLWSRIEAHGQISTHKSEIDERDAYQDYYPGQVLLALSRATLVGITKVQDEKLNQAFKYYRHRFRYKRDFGQVSWLMQAFSLWWEVKREPMFADFVFEIGDWILYYQSEKSGAFINNHQPDTPGYTTALYLEGLGAAARLAASLGNTERHDKYLKSYTLGLQFLDRLIIQPRDASLLPNPEFAIGGLRQSLCASEVRIDFVQHSLSAILEAYPFQLAASS